MLRMLRAPGAAFAVAFGVLYLGTAAWFHLVRELWVGDAISRTANAMYVVFSRDPHLAAIGFVWLPGPSIVQLPLILIADVFERPLFAGNVLTVVCAAATLLVLEAFLREVGVTRWWRIALLVAYAVNPMTIYYAVNGMSEAPFVMLALIVIWQFAVYARTRRTGALFFASLALSGAIWTRYESLALVGAMAIALTLYEVAYDDEHEPVQRAEAVLLTALAAPVLSFALWLFFNWLIQNDPLFFLNSTYGPTAQLKLSLNSGGAEISRASHSLFWATVFGAERLFLLSPAFIPLTAVLSGFAVWKRDYRLIGILGLGGCLPVFSIYQLGTGGSFGWLRFFIYAQPLTLVFGTALVGSFRRSVRQRVYAGLLAAMLVAIPTTIYGLSQGTIGLEEYPVLRKMIDPAYRDAESERRIAAQQIAGFIDALPPDQLVYVETFVSYRVAVLVRHRARLVITNDQNSGEVLDDPIDRLDYILVPHPGGASDLGELAQRFPGIYEFGEPWLSLVREWTTVDGGGWRLYRVIKGPAGAGAIVPPPQAPPQSTPQGAP
ncbi:MAG: hypothetical protein WC273_06455 [Dehalococcoidia bacterium]